MKILVTGERGKILNAELFYVLDLGDALASAVFSRVLQPTLANAVGHLVSFAVNGALWIGLAAIAIRVV